MSHSLILMPDSLKHIIMMIRVKIVLSETSSFCLSGGIEPRNLVLSREDN